MRTKTMNKQQQNCGFRTDHWGGGGGGGGGGGA